jgi:hypothetical protein
MFWLFNAIFPPLVWRFLTIFFLLYHQAEALQMKFEHVQWEGWIKAEGN